MSEYDPMITLRDWIVSHRLICIALLTTLVGVYMALAFVVPVVAIPLGLLLLVLVLGFMATIRLFEYGRRR